MLFLLEELGNVDKALRTLYASLCTFLYKLIAKLFQLFIDVSGIRLNFNVQAIFRRITVVLTIVMTFYIIFEFIKYVVQPDNMTDKEKGVGKIGYKVVAVVLLIAFVPKLFDLAWSLQHSIIKSEAISKIIIGNSGIDGNNIGNSFSAIMLNQFYYYDADYWGDTGDPGNEKCTKGNMPCKRVVAWNINKLVANGEIPNLGFGLGAAKTDPDGQSGEKIPLITFDGLMAVAVGVFIMYILALYTIDLATRIFQLAYLEIIAPIPIMSYLVPKKDSMFNKWVQQCIVTYLDVFIRLAIMYFVLLLAHIISKARIGQDGLINYGNADTDNKLLFVILIMGLLLFAQKAPKLLGELFPKMGVAGGNFGLKAGERVAPLAARALGMAYGGTKLGGALVRRAAHAYATNKANGRHSIFTKEGREERKKDAEHRREMRRANRQYSNFAKDKGAAKEYSEASQKWQEKTNSIKEMLKKGETEKAKAEMAKLKGSDEYKRLISATNAMRNSNMIAAAKRDKRAAEMAELPAKARLKFEQDRLSSARLEHAEALRSGDANSIAITSANMHEAERRAKAAQDDLNKVQEKTKERKAAIGQELGSKIAAGTNFDQVEQQLLQNRDRTREQVLEDRNHHYQGAAGVIVSAVGGTAKTMLQGGKSTKLEDIRKNVQQGVKNDIADVRATQKYYDEGGTGWVDRTVQQVEKSYGIPTAYERTMMESRTMEPKIKKFGAQATLADNFTSTVDAADDRSKSKVRETKTLVKTHDDGTTYIKTGLKNADGSDEYVRLQAGEKTLADVVKRYDQAETDAHSHAVNEQKRYDDFIAEKREELTDARIISKGKTDPNSLSTEEQSRYNEIVSNAARKKNAELASQEETKLFEAKEEASRAEQRAITAKTQVEKNASRENLVAVLRDFNDNSLAGLTPEQKLAKIKAKGHDGALVEKIWDALERMRLLREEPDMVDTVIGALPPKVNDDDPDYISAFMSGNVVSDDPTETWDMFDKINNAAKSASNAKKRAKAAEEEKQRALQTSNETAAQKAANDFTSSGGGK